MSATREDYDRLEPKLTSRMSSPDGDGDMGGFDQFHFDEVSERIDVAETIQRLMLFFTHSGGGAWPSSQRDWSLGQSSRVSGSLGGRACDERCRR